MPCMFVLIQIMDVVLNLGTFLAVACNKNSNFTIMYVNDYQCHVFNSIALFNDMFLHFQCFCYLVVAISDYILQPEKVL